MKKVVYSVRKLGRSECKWTGVGYIAENDLMIPAISKNGKPYIRVFDGAVKHCHPIMDRPNEYKGTYYEVIDAELDTGNGCFEKLWQFSAFIVEKGGTILDVQKDEQVTDTYTRVEENAKKIFLREVE